LRLVDSLPSGAAAPTDPEFAPEGIRRVGERHGLNVVTVSVGTDWVRIAVVEPNYRAAKAATEAKSTTALGLERGRAVRPALANSTRRPLCPSRGFY